MSDDFYRAFEDRHRGSRELIKSRLSVYLQFVEPLKCVYSDCPVIDLGCGRGEWLELLMQNGFTTHGVDLDEGMLKGCHELNLSVEQGNAVSFLSTLPNESQAVVSAFHVVEHISFEQLRTVVSEALRVLKPGGLLIMETPNPENIVVATRNFYLDPTHLRPIPPLLLAFLPEHYGFKRVKIMRLQESSDLAAKEDIGLIDVIAGVSPDYAIVAQKNAPPEVLRSFDAAFVKHYGIELDALANHYDVKLERSIAALAHRLVNAESLAGGMTEALERISILQDRLIDATVQVERSETRATEAETRATEAETRVAEAETRAAEAETRATESEIRATESEIRATEAEARTTDAKAKIDELNHSCHHWWTTAEGNHHELRAVYASRCWRITKPLRSVVHFLLRFRHGVKQVIKAFLKPILAGAIRFVRAHPLLRERALAWVNKHPAVENRLRRFALAHGLIGSYDTVDASDHGKKDNSTSGEESSVELSHLTPHARKIYIDLKAAIAHHHKEND